MAAADGGSAAAAAAEAIAGIRALPLRTGTLLAGQLIAAATAAGPAPVTEVLVADVDWRMYSRAVRSTAQLLSSLTGGSSSGDGGDAAALAAAAAAPHSAASALPHAPVASGSSSSSGGGVESVLETILRLAAQVIGGDSGGTLAPALPLLDAGMDSLGAVQLHMLLKQELGEARVPATLLLDCKTPAAMAAAIEGLGGGSSGGGGGSSDGGDSGSIAGGRAAAAAAVESAAAAVPANGHMNGHANGHVDNGHTNGHAAPHTQSNGHHASVMNGVANGGASSTAALTADTPAVAETNGHRPVNGTVANGGHYQNDHASSGGALAKPIAIGSSSSSSAREHKSRPPLCSPPRPGTPPVEAAAAAAAPAPAAAAAAAAAVADEAAHDVAVHSDNPFHLLRYAVMSLAAYLYVAAAVLFPAWAYFAAARRAYPLPAVAGVSPYAVTIFVAAPLGWLAYIFLLLGTVVASKWLLVGRALCADGAFVAAGTAAHARWWAAQRLMGFARMLVLEELLHTRALAWYLRALGARVGRGALVNTTAISDPDTTTIGAGAVLNEQVVLQGSAATAAGVRFRAVAVGARAVVLPNAVICAGAAVADDALVEPLAVVSPGSGGSGGGSSSSGAAFAWSAWHTAAQCAVDLCGMYAAAVAVGLGALPAFHALSALLRAGGYAVSADGGGDAAAVLADSELAFLCAVSVFLLSRTYLPFVFVFAGADAAVVYALVCGGGGGAAGVAALLCIVAVSMVTFYLCFMAASIALKWVLVGRVRPSKVPVRAASLRGLRKQIGDRVILSGMLRAVLLYNGHAGNAWWLWALGARVGTRVSIFLNKNIYTEPDLLDLGDDVHVGFASATYTCAWVSATHFELKRTTVGARAMLGIGSVLMPGATLPAGSALGPNTNCGPQDALQEGVMYLGAPRPTAVRRYASPPRRLTRAERILYNTIPVPLSLLTTLALLAGAYAPLRATAAATAAFGGGAAAALAPALWLAFGASLCGAAAAVKWGVLGRQRTSRHRMWSWYHYRTVAVFHVYVKSMMLFGDVLRGGALYNAYLRLHGARVSPSAVISSVRISDHDMLVVGDNAVLAEDAVPHPLYYLEGKICIERVEICAGAVMAERSILLGGATVAKGETLGTLQVRARGSGGGSGGGGSGGGAGASSKAL